MDTLLSHILDAANRAPSAHNTQPWLLKWFGDALEVRIKIERTIPAADPKGIDILHSIGAMLENIILTLNQLGYEADYEVSDQINFLNPVLLLKWRPSKDVNRNNKLYRMIPLRRTSRLTYSNELIPESRLNEIRSVAHSPFQLYTVTDKCVVNEIRRLYAKATEVQLNDRSIANELYRWIRFSKKDTRWYRDGLNIECLGYNWLEALGARVLLYPHVLKLISKLKMLHLLFINIDKLAPLSPALCLLTAKGDGTEMRINAGRCLQRIWLSAAINRLVTHPLSAALDVLEIRTKVLELIRISPDENPVSLFRLGKNNNFQYSPRLPVDEILDYN